MLNSRLARDQVTENLHVTERTLLPTFLNRLAAVRLKIEQERLEESLIKKVTRAVPVAVRVARHPLLERHGALHVGRLVLNMSKYLIRLSNTSANDHQRVRMTRRPHAGHSNQGRPCPSQTTRTGFPLIKIFGACLASRHPVVAPLEPRDRPFGERADAVEFERIEAHPVLDQTVGRGSRTRDSRHIIQSTLSWR